MGAGFAWDSRTTTLVPQASRQRYGPLFGPEVVKKGDGCSKGTGGCSKGTGMLKGDGTNQTLKKPGRSFIAPFDRRRDELPPAGANASPRKSKPRLIRPMNVLWECGSTRNFPKV